MYFNVLQSFHASLPVRSRSICFPTMGLNVLVCAATLGRYAKHDFWRWIVLPSATSSNLTRTRRIRPTTSASFRHCMVDLLFVELKVYNQSVCSSVCLSLYLSHPYNCFFRYCMVNSRFTINPTVRLFCSVCLSVYLSRFLNFDVKTVKACISRKATFPNYKNYFFHSWFYLRNKESFYEYCEVIISVGA